jgi:hypothetical protein
MAKNSKYNKSTEELVDEIERSRQQIARNLAGIRDELNLPKRIQRSFRRQPAVWVVGAITLGLILSAISARRKRVSVEAKNAARSKNRMLETGFLLGILKLAATLFKPVIVPFLQRKVGEFSRRPRATESR